ncbi:hypothetical protein ACIBJE_14055 [Micromonospora sp. NPDC050187]|uniref:hypothetical protein n=1 Tax=Micromonospora sp. NPDC050187 TaxID=3364277 RepID=UPI003788A306
MSRRSVTRARSRRRALAAAERRARRAATSQPSLVLATTVVLPESCRANLLAGLAAVPVLDAPAVTTVIAWPPHSRSRALADLVRVATRL